MRRAIKCNAWNVMSSQFRSRFLCCFVFTIECFEGGRVADTICSVYYRNMLQSWKRTSLREGYDEISTRKKGFSDLSLPPTLPNRV